MAQKSEIKRKEERKILRYYLKVIDLKKGTELGRVVDITNEGMMVFGNSSLVKTKPYSVRIILDKNIMDSKLGLGNLDVDVQIRWIKPDSNPMLTLTGMYFLNLDKKGKEIIKALVKKLGMDSQLGLIDEELENEEEEGA